MFLIVVGAVCVCALAIVVARLLFALPPNQAERTTVLRPAVDGQLAGSVVEKTAEHPDLSGIVPLARGTDAFAARMLLADAAVSSIDAQYYIWHADLTGYLLLDALKRAADRGVRVRLLLDDNGTAGLDAELAALDAHPNVQVRLWNPFNLRRFKVLAYAFDFFRLNRRMHNKSFTVDNRASIVGGRNVGDEYFDTGPAALYIDLDVLTVGKVVPEIARDFDRYWNSPSAYPADQIVGDADSGEPIAAALDRLRHSPQMSSYQELVESSGFIDDLGTGRLDIEWAAAILVSDDPAKGQGALPRQDLLAGHLTAAVGTITRRFDGVSPYFVPGDEGVAAFAQLEQRGVEVRMLTNSLAATDVLPVHAGYAKRRDDLLQQGVELFELRRRAALKSPTDTWGPFGSSGASLHAKTFAVDGERIFVGSFNFDPRSARLNTEMGLLIHSEPMATSLHQAFDNGLGGLAWRVELREGHLVWIDMNSPDAPARRKEPGDSFWKSVAIKLIGWLPVEWLL